MTVLSRVATSGAPLARAKAAVVLLHGRGASAEGMFELAEMLALPNVAYLAPQAVGGSWYPHSFLAPLGQNEPHLSRALATVGELTDGLSSQGLGSERVALLGFSQGGCLALEFAARNARRYGAVVGLSAGLIGPEGTPRAYAGSLDGTPVFFGCSNIDSHIPLRRVQESSRILQGLGANVVERIYPGMGHTVNDDEIDHVRAALMSVLQGASSTSPPRQQPPEHCRSTH